MVSHWSLSDSKSPQVFKTLLSILTDLNHAVVWMVSTRLLIFKSSCPCTNHLMTVPRALITIGIIVTFMCHSSFNSLARSRDLFVFSHSFDCTLWSAGTAKSTILQLLYLFIYLFYFLFILFYLFFDYYNIWSFGRDLVICLYVEIPE